MKKTTLHHLVDYRNHDLVKAFKVLLALAERGQLKSATLITSHDSGGGVYLLGGHRRKACCALADAREAQALIEEHIRRGNF